MWNAKQYDKIIPFKLKSLKGLHISLFSKKSENVLLILQKWTNIIFTDEKTLEIEHKNPKWICQEYQVKNFWSLVEVLDIFIKFYR